MVPPLMNKFPAIIYKYKGIETKEDLVRLLDIINNHRIYLPSYKQLNDPLEGQVVDIGIDGYAGMSMLSAADEEEPVIASHREKYKVLSFSSENNNPQLWAHYANGYEGVCLCFSTKRSFSKIKEIDYCDAREGVFAGNENRINKEVLKSFYKKNSGWNYEKEWRLVKKTKNNYMSFDQDEIVGLIFGHKLSDEIRKFIIGNICSDIVLMKTYIGYRSFQIRMLPINHDFVYDGVPLRSLDVEKTLAKKKYVYRKDGESTLKVNKD